MREARVPGEHERIALDEFEKRCQQCVVPRLAGGEAVARRVADHRLVGNESEIDQLRRQPGVRTVGEPTPPDPAEAGVTREWDERESRLDILLRCEERE